MITLLRIRFSTETALAIADPGQASAVDLPVVRNPRAEPYVPVTSLAGSLREHLRSKFGDEATDDLMGFIRSEDTVGEDASCRASHIRILGSQLELPQANAKIKTRRQTAIDRERGATAAKMLRLSEEISAGATITVFLQIDGDVDIDRDELLGSFARWRPVLGRGKGQGMGRCELRSIRSRALDLDAPDDLRLWLTTNGPALFEDAILVDDHEIQAVADGDAATAPWLIAQFAIDEDFMIDGVTEIVDGHHVTRSATTIRGSSLKGSVRSGVEFILRSLVNHGEFADGYRLVDDDVTQILEELFGSLERRGSLTFEDAPLEGAEPERRQHVAVDRITGGACPGRLFTDEPLVGGGFALQVRSGADAPPAWAKTLVWSALADLHDGYRGLGAGTSRGYGTVRLTETPHVEAARTALAELVPALTERARRRNEEAPHA